MWVALLWAATGLAPTRASAEALLVIEADTGKVLFAQNAGYPWYPASVTKLMTAYVTLHAIKDGRITLDQLLTVSANAVAQSPVKMGFRVGTQVTVDNALKMMMVKSANDIAVVLAEGVGGSIEGFADLMNWHARHLGMVESTFVNPNGLPADDQVSSARDLAILARALIREFPEYDYYWHLPGIRMGKMVQRNYNTLLGRYPGADGMKTGFICAAGFNLVASATRNGKRLIAVVLGAPSSAVRALKAAQLLERGFGSTGGLNWLMPSQGTVETIEPIRVDPPNLRDEICGPHRKRPASEDEDEITPANTGPDSPYGIFLSSLRPKTKGALLQDVNIGEPVLVFTGTKPPAPGSATADSNIGAEKKKSGRKKTAAAKPAADAAQDGAASPAAEAPAPKPKGRKAKPAADTTHDGAASPADDAPAAKPKPKKKTAAKPVAVTPAAANEQTSQTH
ncbi:MAG TPA: D-alanyl-D-alanine carboxypeptidase family protein [Xanthobacteraceae bacterium]|jgi:D-alanyl-D-alanine carboxypeptidase